MTVVSSLVLVGSLLAQPGPTSPSADGQTRQIGTRATTDQTLPVARGTRIDLDDCRGQVTVRTWDRDAVRVQANHSPRTKVVATVRDQVLVIENTGSMSAGVEFELTVPEWIGLTIESQVCSAEIEGVNGTIAVATIEGDILMRNIGGSATAKSVEGNITIEGGKGRIQAHTFDGSISITKAGGEIAAESVDGNIIVTHAVASAVEVSTVDGDVTFTGSFQPGGRYLFTTHSGSVRLVIPENTSATVGVRSFNGGKVDSTIALKPVSAGGRGRRNIFTLGSGSAQVEVESFDGAIRIRRPGDPADR